MTQNSKKSKKSASWFWSLWSAVFLISGLGIATCSYFRPQLTSRRDGLLQQVETQQKILVLRQLWTDLQLVQLQIRQREIELKTGELNDRDRSEINARLQDLRDIQASIQTQRLEAIVTALRQDIDFTRGFARDAETFTLEKPTLKYFAQVFDFDRVEVQVSRDRETLDKTRYNLLFLGNGFSFAVVVATANLLVGLTYYWFDRWNVEQTQKIQEVDEQIEQAKAHVQNFSWNMASASLEKYYQRNLMEVQVIFMTSIIVMVLGFILILASLAASLFAPNEPVAVRVEASESISALPPSETAPSPPTPTPGPVASSPRNTVGLVGVAAGIITNFIGATLMVIYRSTVQEASRYSDSLSQINDVGMAMDILNTAAKENDTPEILQAKVEIAKRIIERSRSVREPKSRSHSN